jgi:aminoglycoside 6'-N-acetyltransferase
MKELFVLADTNHTNHTDANGKLSVRPLQPSDAHVLLGWLNDERVLEFYEGRDRPHDMQMIQDHFLSKKGDPVVGCLVEHEDEPIGYVQYYPTSDGDKECYGYSLTESIYGMDQFIGEPSYWNRGIGTQLVTAMADFLFREMRASKVIMDPQARNPRSIRCYEKCGFTKVKLLPQREIHEGVLQDCWLMEKSN